MTIKCDWPGCEATVTYVPRLPFPDQEFGWQHESNGHCSHHLCPKQKRHDWQELLTQQAKARVPAPGTGRFMA